METQLKTEPAPIQDKLVRLQKSDSSEEHLKACLFNLIVYTHDSQRTEYFKKIISLIMQQFPCRIFFIECNPGSPQEKLQLDIQTNKASDERGIFCDTIYIRTGEENLSQVPFLLLPLFIPDLPIYLLWGQDPSTETTILPYLEKFAKRLIFDSEKMEDLQKFSCNVLNQIHSSYAEIVDMTWVRISGWREVLSQTYDSPERFAQLKTANTIKITYNRLSENSSSNPEKQAIYFQAWIASRFGWEFKEMKGGNGAAILQYISPEGNHIIEIVPGNDPLFSAEELLEMEVKGEQDYVCNFKRKDNHQVIVHAYNQYQCELPFTLLMPALDSGRNLMQEIIYQKISDHYLPTLKLISSINWRSIT